MAASLGFGWDLGAECFLGAVSGALGCCGLGFGACLGFGAGPATGAVLVGARSCADGADCLGAEDRTESGCGAARRLGAADDGADSGRVGGADATESAGLGADVLRALEGFSIACGWPDAALESAALRLLDEAEAFSLVLCVPSVSRSVDVGG